MGKGIADEGVQSAWLSIESLAWEMFDHEIFRDDSELPHALDEDIRT